MRRSPMHAATCSTTCCRSLSPAASRAASAGAGASAASSRRAPAFHCIACLHGRPRTGVVAGTCGFKPAPHSSVPPAHAAIACRTPAPPPESGGPPKESAMSHVRKAALPLLVVALGAALAACSRNEEAAEAAATTPATAPAGEDVHAFRIGALQAAALRDGGMSVPNDNAVFGVGLTPKEVAGVLAGAGLETDVLHLSVQPLLVRDGGRVYLFDAGAGQLMGENAGKLGASLQAAGVEPAQVT